MPAALILITGFVLALRLALGDYVVVKPSFFVATVSFIAAWLFLFCVKGDIRKPMAMRMLAIAVTMPLLAWSVPSLGLLFVIMCVWVPLAAGRFDLFAPVYLFSLLLLPGLDHTLMLGPVKLVEFGVHDALALGAALAIFVNPAKARGRVEWDFAVMLVVFTIAMATARETTASHHLRALTEISLELALPYYIVSRGLRSSEELKAAMLWLGASGVVVAGLLVFEVWKAWPIYQELYPLHELPTLMLVKLRAGLIRAGGPFVEPTSVAMVLAICVTALYLSRDAMRNRGCYLLVIGALVAGLIAPQSRGAWIGAAIAIAAADLLRGHYVQLGQKLFVVGGAVSMLFLSAQFDPALAETLGMSGGSSETSEYRRLLLSRGLEVFAERPFTGYSMRQLQELLPDLVQGEGIIDFVNSYIWMMLIAGLSGLLVFVAPFVLFLLAILRRGRFQGAAKRDVEAGAFVFGILLMYLEMLFFTSFGTRPALCLFGCFGFAVAFLRLQHRPAEELVSTEEAPVPTASFELRPIVP